MHIIRPVVQSEKQFNVHQIFLFNGFQLLINFTRRKTKPS